MRLYHLPGSRSARVLWLLEEIGEPYEVTTLTREGRKEPEHLARHPLGRVPVLDDGEGPVFESAGLCLHLADQHPELGLLPAPGTHDRALAYQWTFFGMTELEPAVIEAAFYEDDEARTAKGKERFRAAAEVLENELGDKEYLVGGGFTVADLVCGSVLTFAKRRDLLEDLPNCTAYMERVESRPARERARAIDA